MCSERYIYVIAFTGKVLNYIRCIHFLHKKKETKLLEALYGVLLLLYGYYVCMYLFNVC